MFPRIPTTFALMCIFASIIYSLLSSTRELRFSFSLSKGRGGAKAIPTEVSFTNGILVKSWSMRGSLAKSSPQIKWNWMSMCFRPCKFFLVRVTDINVAAAVAVAFSKQIVNIYLETIVISHWSWSNSSNSLNFLQNETDDRSIWMPLNTKTPRLNLLYLGRWQS